MVKVNRMGQEWTNAKNPPEAGVPVIALGKNGAGKVRRIRACYVPKYFMEDDDDSFSGDADYNEDNDTFYWPEGWYEWNEMEETHWLVDFEITHWTPLPELPVGY